MQKIGFSCGAKFYTMFIIGTLCLLGQSCQRAFAQFSIPVASIEYLSLTSEIIVRGRITAIEGKPYYPGGPVNKGIAHIQVDKVIKGNWDDQVLHFTFPDVPLPMDNWLVVGEYGLLFLKKANGENVPVDPRHIMLPVREGMPASADKSQKVLSVIRDEMLFTALGPSVFSKENQYKQQESAKIDPTNMFSDPLPMNLTALTYLAIPTWGRYGVVIPSNEHATNTLKTFLSTLSTNKSNTALRGAILSTLLALGQFDVLDEAIKFVESVPYEETGGVVGAIGYVNGAQYVPALGNLLKNNGVEMRRSAATALWSTVLSSNPDGKLVKNLKESVTLPFLIEALDDSDSQVRLRALQALPIASNKRSWSPPLPIQGKIPPQEEHKLITQWKQWWKSEGSKAFGVK